MHSLTHSKDLADLRERLAKWRHKCGTNPSLKRGTQAMQTPGFESDRGGVLFAMERFCRPEQPRVDHAFFGPMSYGEWMRFGWLQTDCHLRQFGR